MIGLVVIVEDVTAIFCVSLFDDGLTEEIGCALMRSSTTFRASVYTHDTRKRKQNPQLRSSNQVMFLDE